MNKVNLAEKLALFSDHWKPKVVGELNGQQVKLVKAQGEFVWHSHADEDELFLVLRGQFAIHFRDRVTSRSASPASSGRRAARGRALARSPRARRR